MTNAEATRRPETSPGTRALLALLAALALALVWGCGQEDTLLNVEEPTAPPVPEDEEDGSSGASHEPAPVTDLEVVEVADGSVVLGWTEVDDGRGGPSDYQLRWDESPIDGWGEAELVRDGSCASPVEGARIGARITCMVTGLDSTVSLDFRIAAIRRDSAGSPVHAPHLSNVVTVVARTPDDGDGDSDGDPVDGDRRFEPAGFSRITENSFSSLEEAGWRASSELRIVTDTTAPRSPDGVGQVRYPEGWTGGYAPAWTEASISGAGARKLYASFWVKLSENWQAHPVVNKVAYFWTHEMPVVVPAYIGEGHGPLRTQIRIQDVPDGARSLEANVEPPEIRRGAWHHWEVLFVSNNGDAADGEIHWWVDGRKAGEYRDVRFGTSGQSKIWDYASWRPIWGGAGSEVQADQYMWMDDTYVSGAP